MPKIAVVGSRDGADLEHVERFLRELFERDNATILVSGGNKSTERSVDHNAEQLWLKLGGRVISFRPRKLKDDGKGEQTWGVERWELGGPHPRVFLLEAEPTWANYESAAFYRDILIAEEADRVVAFHKPLRSRGAAFTAEIARVAYEKPSYEFEKGR